MVALMMDDENLVGAWGRFLQRFPWLWYCTLTFRGCPSVERARRTFRFWMHHLNRKQLGVHYVDRGHAGIRHIIGLEWQRRGSPHLHALMIDCDRLSIPEAVAEWKALAGDAEIVPFDRDKGACFYIAKTYAGDGPAELDFGGAWSAHHARTLSRMRSADHRSA